jgi:hypothetical protein
LGIPVEVGFIMFNPYSTVSTIIKNAEFLMSLQMGILFHHFSSKIQLQPGVGIINSLERDGMLKEQTDLSDVYYYKFHDPIVETVADALESIYYKMAVHDRMILTYYLGLYYLTNKISLIKKTPSNILIKQHTEKISFQFNEIISNIAKENFNLFQKTIRLAQERWSSKDFTGLSEAYIKTNMELANTLGALYNEQYEIVMDYGDRVNN